MNSFECSPRTPWGLHAAVRNDEDCPRCGWTAPGPRSDPLCLTVVDGGVQDPLIDALPESRAA